MGWLNWASGDWSIRTNHWIWRSTARRLPNWCCGSAICTAPRTRLAARPCRQSSVLRIRHIECRDAVLAHDGAERALDKRGQPLTRWDGGPASLIP